FDDILSLKVTPEPGELKILEFLKDTLDDSFEVFFNPFLNGDRPDIVIIRENYGVLIIEVKDYHLNSYELDEKKNWYLKSNNAALKSPISQVLKYKDNLFNLHIEKLLEKKILDIRSFNFVSCAVYFHNATHLEVQDFIVQPFKEDKRYQDFLRYNITLLGNDDLVEDKFSYNLKPIDIYKQEESDHFTTEIYKSFKRFLNPPFHYKESVPQTIPYSKKQLELIYAGELKKEQRIRGVVGSGKTTVLAARAVQAVRRTNSQILILTYNIPLKNYIKDKISAVREDFDWTN
ncbi:nuclease-related domain-containing protein, partial [Myroides odoratimimus]|uniref:nuclease-related domain-containing protein n=1 Tax=Myroides odoratimimus TaxID=76832 RepID=UPI0025786BAA